MPFSKPSFLFRLFPLTFSFYLSLISLIFCYLISCFSFQTSYFSLQIFSCFSCSFFSISCFFYQLSYFSFLFHSFCYSFQLLLHLDLLKPLLHWKFLLPWTLLL